MHRPESRLVVATVLVAGVMGCMESRPVEPVPSRQVTAAVDNSAGPQLIHALDEFEDFFSAAIDGAATEIESRATSRDARKAALMWKIRTITQCNDVVNQPEPAAALVDTWVLCVRMQQAVETGAAKDLFGENQAVAIGACQRAAAHIEHIAAQNVPSEQLEQIKASVMSYAEQNPMGATFAAPAAEQLSATPTDKRVLAWLMTPLAPLQTFSKINRTADSISDLKPVAERFTEIINDLPAKARWQLQLLLMNLEEAEAVRSALASMQTFSESSARMATVAENLPERLRQESTALLDDVDARQGKLQETLASTRQTVEQANAGLERAETVAASIERSISAATEAAAAWEKTAGAVRETVQSVAELKREDQASKPAGEDEKPFDIAEYSAAADRVTCTAEELRGLVADLRGLLDSPELTGSLEVVETRTQATVNLTAERLEGLSDHIAWRAAQLVALVFALAVVYRLVFRRRAGGGAES